MNFFGIAESLKTTKCDFEKILSISDDQDFKLSYSIINSWFVNNYVRGGLKAVEANMDIHLVFRKYNVFVYMGAHLFKPEDEWSPATTQTVTDSFEKELENHEHMKSLANVYLNEIECSGQDCIFQVLACFLVTITKPEFYENPVTIALVYRSPNISMSDCTYQLVYFTNARRTYILLWYVNIDGDAYARLYDVLSSYSLMVMESTH